MSKPTPAEFQLQVNVRMPRSLRERIEAFAKLGNDSFTQTLVSLLEIGLEAVGEGKENQR